MADSSYIAEKREREKKEVLRRFERRYDQKKGSKEKPECHRVPHQVGVKVVKEHYDEMTVRELENLKDFVDGDTRSQPKAHNDKHSRHERALKSNLESGKDLKAADADRAEVWISRIEKAVDSGKLMKKNAERLMDHIARHSTRDQLSLMQRWKNGRDQRTVSAQFKVIVDKVYNRHVTDLDVAAVAAKQNVRQDGKVSERSSLCKQGFLKYKESGAVDRRCAAFKQGVVDEHGHLVDCRKKTSTDKVEKKGAEVEKLSLLNDIISTVYSGKGRPKATDYNADGSLNSVNEVELKKHTKKEMELLKTQLETVYKGRGRPRATDYQDDGLLRRAIEKAEAQVSSVYSGRGRPKATDYNVDGSLNRGCTTESSSSSSQYSTPSRSYSSSNSGSSGATVYSGHGRPRASDYTAGGNIRRK